MAKKSSKDVSFLIIGGRSVLSAGFTTIGESYEDVLEEITGLGDSDDKWGAVEERKFEMNQEGFYDIGANKWHEALEETDPQVLMYAPVGNAIGDRLVALDGIRTTYNRLPARGAFHKASAVYKGNSGPENYEQRIAEALSEKSGDGNSASNDWGATVVPYTTGTASFTNGSAAVVGTTTVWTSAHVGQKIKLDADGVWYQ